MERTEQFFADIMTYIDIEFEASASKEGSSKENIFTSRIASDLCSGNSPAIRGLQADAFRYENPSTNTKINGYFIDDVENSVWVYVTLFKSEKTIQYINQPEIEYCFKKLNTFMQRIITEPQELLSSLGEDHIAYGLVYYLSNNLNEICSVNYVLLTNGRVREIKLPSFKFNSIKVDTSLFDIERYRRFSDGLQVIQIDADMDILKKPIPCSSVYNDKGKYDTYCCILSGNIIFRLFDTYHYQLLNSNVRTYLQLRGGVNQGIMKTIEQSPERFLAYNNGISATASEVVTDIKKNIILIKDFQIVNGGQTSASIYNAKSNKGLSIDDINVLAKITVIKDNKNRDEIVKNISRYANTQNAIKFSDFSSNDPYNIKLKELSRTIFTPPINNRLQTKWYYESVAGTYNIDQADRGGSFNKEYPKKQLFSKTDMAAYELAYQGLPYEACKGAQDAYKVFVMNLPSLEEPTEKEFKQLIAKKILFDSTLNIINELVGGQGKKHMTSYVVAYYSERICDFKLNLEDIWQHQQINTETYSSIKKLVPAICKYLRDNAIVAKKSVEMYCRQPTTWDACKTKYFDAGTTSFATTGQRIKPVLTNRLLNTNQAQLLTQIKMDYWVELKNNCNLISDGNYGKEQKYASMCVTMATTDVKKLSERQIAYALKLLYYFYKNKYRLNPEITNHIRDNIEKFEWLDNTRISKFSQNTYFK